MSVVFSDRCRYNQMDSIGISVGQTGGSGEEKETAGYSNTHYARCYRWHAASDGGK
jgi:hypothetical protein